MSDSRQPFDWSEVAIAMDRSLRVFADFSRPILIAHDADTMSITNLLFLVSVGEGEARVNDLVRGGRYIGSNASYSLKSLQNGGFIERHQDPSDKRNAIVVCTERGRALVVAIKSACSSKTGAPRDVMKLLQTFEDHCTKFPAS